MRPVIELLSGDDADWAEVPWETTAGVGLTVEDLRTGYRGNPVVFDVSLRVEPGEVTALFGHNGSGKTSLIKALAGINPVLSGRVRIGGFDITHRRPDERVRSGLVYLPQPGGVFATMSVHDNLVLGATMVRDRSIVDQRVAEVTERFPVLAARRNQLAGTMSGGEQRMLSIGIALMAGGRVLLLDEPSLGLAPAIIREVFDAARRLAHDEGLAVLLVEQMIGQTLPFADHVYVMRGGRMIAEHTRAEALARTNWWDVF